MTSSLRPQAATGPLPTGGERARPQIAVEAASLEKVARHIYALMLRNIASDGYPFRDSSGRLLSQPGCVIAAPSYPGNTPGIDQDYVFHWVRDAAITIAEVTAAVAVGSDDDEALVDYVTFAKLCQTNATPTLAHAFAAQVKRAKAERRLHYVHLSAPDRGVLADSWIDWPRFLTPICTGQSTLGYDGPYLVEVFNAIPVFLDGLRLTRRKFWIPGEDDPIPDRPSAYDVARDAIATVRAAFARHCS